VTPYRYQAELDALRAATKAAAEATQEHLNKNPNTWYPCGFAWVKVKPARGRFVEMCKDQKVGHTNECEGGYDIWNPSGNNTQWMDAKEIGCRAFVTKLNELLPSLKLKVCTRID
jgi:hypothetical protein